jgi:hypothetical protein
MNIDKLKTALILVLVFSLIILSVDLYFTNEAAVMNKQAYDGCIGNNY